MRARPHSPIRRTPKTPKALYAVRRVGRDGVIVVGLKARASDDDENDLVGVISATPRDRMSVRGRGFVDISEVCDGVACSPSIVYEIDHVSLDDRLHGHGLGAWLFSEAARIAWKEKMAAIISTRAFGGSETSMAQRVWSSRRLSEHVATSGMVGVWRHTGREDDPTPPLGDVSIVERKTRHAAAKRKARRHADVELDIEEFHAKGFDRVNVTISDDDADGDDGAQAVVGPAEDITAWLRDAGQHGTSVTLADAIDGEQEAESEVAYLFRLKVHPAMQGRGVGEAVIDRLLGRLRLRGTSAVYAVMELDGDTSASSVRRFLVRHGFEELPGHDKGRPMWRMRLDETAVRRSNPPANARAIVTWHGRTLHVGITPLRPLPHGSTRTAEINAKRSTRSDLSASCLASFDALNSERSEPAVGMFVVEQSSLVDELHGKGIGAWMYAEIARLAWLHHRCAIVASACEHGGSTSENARGVWGGRKLRRNVDTDGLVGVWREDMDASTPVPQPPPIAFVPRSDLDRRPNPQRGGGAVDPETGVTEAELMALWGPVGRWIGGGEFNALNNFGRMFMEHARTLDKLRRREPIEVWRASNGRRDEFSHPSAWTLDRDLAVSLVQGALESGPSSPVGARSLLHTTLQPEDVWLIVPDLQAAADRMGLRVLIDSQGWGEVVARSDAYKRTAADRKAFSAALAAGKKLERIKNMRQRRAEAARVVDELISGAAKRNR